MYQHGKKPAKTKDKRVFLKVALVLGITLVSVAWILHKDLTSTTDERTTVPIITDVAGVTDDTIKVTEPQFYLELPSDWKQTRRVNESYANYYEWQSTKQGGNDRRLLLHIDIMPKSYKLVRMQPVTVTGNGLRLGNISGDCLDFATDTGKNRSSNEVVEAKWEGVKFNCDPISANQTVGTGTEASSIAAKVGNHTYFFYYEDHNIRPNDEILRNILRSFQAK